MRILMILDREFPTDLRVENEIEFLQQEGHQIDLACFTRKGAQAFEETELCRIHRKAISKLVYKSSVGALVVPVYFNFWRGFIGDLLRDHKYDAIHVHDLPLVRVGVEFCKKYNMRLVADLHENWPAFLRISQHTRSLAGRVLSPDRKWVNYEVNILQEADDIIVVVDEARERLMKLGFPGERIHVVSNTLNLKHVTLSEKAGEHPRMILYYAGGLNYHRGLQVVIEAMTNHRVRTDNFTFWILGEGRYKKELARLRDKLDLDERVILYGWIPYRKMTEMMMQADYAMIPHLRSDHTDTTIPHKLFQYMYARKPVIASDCPPIKRIIEETACGYTYPAKDSDALAAILAGLKPGNGRDMGENGHKSVIAKYNFASDAEALCGIYRSS